MNTDWISCSHRFALSKGGRLLRLPAVALTVFIMLFILAGCYRAPFERTELVPMGGVDPFEAAAAFSARLPSSFETENDSVIFRFLWREMAALGYSRVDLEAETFEITCMTHVGVQLFHISGTAEESALHYALPQFSEYPGFVESIGEDIRRIYSGMVPAPNAQAKVSGKRINFREDLPEGTIEHVFGGREPVLLEKSLRSGFLGRRQWEVAYYEYDDSTGKLFPRGIVMRNHKYGYRLVIRIRNVTFEPSN